VSIVGILLGIWVLYAAIICGVIAFTLAGAGAALALWRKAPIGYLCLGNLIFAAIVIIVMASLAASPPQNAESTPVANNQEDTFCNLKN